MRQRDARKANKSAQHEDLRDGQNSTVEHPEDERVAVRNKRIHASSTTPLMTCPTSIRQIPRER